MPKGHINLKLLDAGGRGDKDFITAQKDGTLDELLEKLTVLEEYDHSNQISHYVAGQLFYEIFGAPGISSNIQTGNSFHYVGFGNSATEYDYSFTEYIENLASGMVPYTVVNVTDFNCKRMSTGIREHKLTVEPSATGLRAAHDAHTWLWLPTAIISDAIREFKITATDDQGDGWYVYDECRTTVRTRIKDANGVPQTISKTTNEVLLLQWTITMKII